MLAARSTSAVLCGLAFTFYAPVRAHHAFAIFDTTARITVTGRVTEYDWVNPHVRLGIDGAEAHGGVKRWTLELSGPGTLQRLGWSRHAVHYRDRVTAVVFPLKDGGPGGLLVQLTLPDGRVLANTGPVAPR